LEILSRTCLGQKKNAKIFSRKLLKIGGIFSEEEFYVRILSSKFLDFGIFVGSFIKRRVTRTLHHHHHQNFDEDGNSEIWLS